MPRTPAQNKEIIEKRKAKILERALQLFAIEGFDNVAIDDIAKKARCAHGLIYHYYPTKEDILEALVNKAKTKPDLLPPLEEAKEAEIRRRGLIVLASYYQKVQEASKDEVAYYALLWLSLRNQEKAKGLPFLKDLNVQKTLISLIKKERLSGSTVNASDENLAETWIYLAIGALRSRLETGLANHKKVSAESFLRLVYKN